MDVVSKLIADQRKINKMNQRDSKNRRFGLWHDVFITTSSWGTFRNNNISHMEIVHYVNDFSEGEYIIIPNE